MHYYLIIGGCMGAAVFMGNMLSICIPGNLRVDPVYVYDNMNLSKVGNCLIIAGTKSIIVAATWPLITLRIVKDLIYDTYNAGNLLHLGYFNSPHYICSLTEPEQSTMA